tara:strand:+ start:8078 stop:10534 length:2457 start_codon:yes stop_codon:yes gene_type:complete
MAVTERNLTSDGSTSYTFPFEYLKTTDVKVSVNGTAETEFIVPSGFPTTVQFNTGHVPASGAAIRIYRDTNVDVLEATFYAGSAIKSQDLNDNFNQNLYVTQEAKRDAQAAWQSGDETINSSETWQSDNTKVATTGAIDGRIDTKIDTALETDVLAGTDLAKTQTGGQVTINHSVTGASSVNNSNGTVIQDLTINANGHVTATGSYNLDNRYYNKTDLDGGQLNNLYFTESELTSGALDGRYFTETECDARYFNVSTGDTIKDGDAFPDNDTTIATTAAINDRIIDLVDDVGGFTIIASEQTFPNVNPQGVTGQAAVLSIKEATTDLVPTGTTLTVVNGNVANNANITITGVTSTIPSGFGFLIESTSTLHTYTFHRLVPKATQVTTVATSIANVNNVGGSISNVNAVAGNATNINTVAANNTNVTTVGTNIANVNTVASNITDVSSFKDLYQISTSAPSTDGGGNSLAAGDMWFDSSANKTLKVHNGTDFQSVSPSQSVLNDIAIVSGEVTFVEDLGFITSALTTGTGNNINTVATGINNVNSVAGISANITTVAGIAANVTTVAGNATNINAVAGNSTNINAVVANATNINTVANNNGNITSVAQSLSGTQAYAVTVANVGGSNYFFIDSVQAPVLNLIRGFTYTFDVSNASNSNHPLRFKDGSGNSYTTGVTTSGTEGQAGATVTLEVASNAPSSLRYYCTVHGNGMGNTIATADSNIGKVAGSIADINRYATEYTISNSTPSSPSSGDLWYDGANNILKFYNSSSFVGITPGLTDVVNDTSPELGGNLDCNDRNLTEVGTVSGNNLQIDFGTLT